MEKGLEGIEEVKVRKNFERNLTGLGSCIYLAQQTHQKFVGLLVQMEGFPKPEFIVNENENFGPKLVYYKKAYNEDLTLKSFNGIKIIAYAFGEDPNEILDYLKNNL